jgi:hypothetical protein
MAERGQHRARLGRLIDSGLKLGLGLVTTFVAWHLARHLFGSSYYDFNLHYFGGYVERHGISYTNTSVLVRVAHQHHTAVNPDGIYGTPPLVALIFKPISILSLHVAQTLWAVVAVVGVTFAVRKATCASPRWPLWLAVTVFAPAMLEAFTLGNPAWMTFVLLAYAFGALRQNQESRAAIALGFAIAFKAYPAFLLLVFVRRRQWKALATAIGTAAVCVAATLPVLGLRHSREAFSRMIHVAGLVDPYKENASIPALIQHFTHSTEFARIAGVALLLGGTILVLRMKSRVHVTMAVASLVMLLAQSISWQMYFSIALFAILCLHEVDISMPRRAIGWFAGLLALGWATYPLPGISELLVVTQIIGACALIGVLTTSVATNKTPSSTA